MFPNIKMFIWIVFISSWGLGYAERPSSFRVGSVFLESDLLIHQSIRNIADGINNDQEYLNGSRMDLNVQFAQNDPFDALQKACLEMDLRVISVFGTSSSTIDRSVGSVCNALRIPYFTTEPAANTLKSQRDADQFVLHLGPSQQNMVDVVVDSVMSMKWKELALITHRLTGTLDSHLLTSNLLKAGIKVKIHDLRFEDNRPGIVDLRKENFQNFIVDMASYHLGVFFKQALESGIVNSGTKFFLVNLDSGGLQYETVRLTGASIIGLSIVNKDRIEENKSNGKISKDLSLVLTENDFRAALLFDGLHLLAKSVEKLTDEKDLEIPNVTCKDKEEKYPMAKDLLQKIHEAEFEGLTGRLNFKNGIRQEIQFTINKLNISGSFTPIGFWHKSAVNGVKFHMNNSYFEEETVIQSLRLATQKLRVGTVLSHTLPYIRKTNDTFEGLLFDLISKLGDDLGFTFSIEEFVDYGHLDKPGGEWSGMVGKLVYKEVDIGLADFLVTPERMKVVSFSPPYQTIHSTILKKIQSDPDSNDFFGSWFFLFLNPFTLQMWMAVLISYVLTSLFLFVVARISPYDRQPYFTISNCFWFMLEGILRRSTQSLQPKSLSSRLLTGYWWLFCNIILVIYILSIGSGFYYKLHGQSEQDLDWFLRSNDARLSAFLPSSTANLLKMSKDPIQKQVWEKINQNGEDNFSHKLTNIPEYLLENSKTGFVMESPFADYLTSKHCELESIGHFGERHFALAFPKTSDWKEIISIQIMKYIQDGTMESLNKKWFNNQGNCDSGRQEGLHGSQEEPFTPAKFDILGPFLLLLISGVTSLVVALAEIFIYSYFASKQSPRRGTYGSLLKSELRKSVSCNRSKSNTMTGSANNLNGNGFRFRGNPSNLISDNAKSATIMKNGHSFQAQALLRNEASDDGNSQL